MTKQIDSFTDASNGLIDFIRTECKSEKALIQLGERVQGLMFQMILDYRNVLTAPPPPPRVEDPPEEPHSGVQTRK